jgi:hypothetical protein
MNDQRPPQPIRPDDEAVRRLVIIIHRGLKSIVVALEKEYQIGDHAPEKPKKAA